MKIKMLFTEKASPNGIQIEVYNKGEVYETGVTITQQIADIFVKNRIALDVTEPEIPKPVKKQADKKEKNTKAHLEPPEDK